MINFYVSRECESLTAIFFSRFPHFDAVPSNLVPGQVASIFQVQQVGIVARELQKREAVFEMTISLAPSPLSLLNLPNMIWSELYYLCLIHAVYIYLVQNNTRVKFVGLQLTWTRFWKV